MSENNKTYRIRTEVNSEQYVTVNLEQDYDYIDILSLKINGLDAYKQHSSKYGVIVGRVLANNGFGVPNAKISVFVESESPNSNEIDSVYPFKSTLSRDSDGVRYNLLPNEKVSDCHQVVGTFPSKRFMLDSNILVEVFDTYYKYTTRTNNSGDYMLACIPVGQHTIHMDLDLSDCGILSQRPRDFVYKGYNVEQFENPNQFKSGHEFESLSQIFSQDQIVHVQPFWGNESQGDTIGITRADINIAYKFEPTCVFIGCIVSDNSSQGISKNCVPTPHMGDMDELVTGKGRIEMIRKTLGGSVEEFQINGTELINGEGIWCYQIPMNLDYMMTDEYGNMVPTDNPERGIPTRARVRFRMSMEDMEENVDNFFRAKVLVPHNPQNLEGTKHEDYDYEFGTYTKDESYRDLFWNNVYSVKSYIPRFQKRKVLGWNELKFTGIKHCQDYGSNNPIPYNNIRIKLPFMFMLMCILVKVFIKIVAIYNRVVALIGNLLCSVAETINGIWGFARAAGSIMKIAQGLHLNVIEDGLCPDLENWYFAPLLTKNGVKTKQTVRVKTEENGNKHDEEYDLVQQTMDVINDEDGDYDDTESLDYQNDDNSNDAICITFKTDYLISCVEMNLAQEYKVINFDFYNDWVNGMVYFPRWMRYIRQKRKFMGKATIIKSKTKACMDNTRIFSKTRRYTQMCSLACDRKTTNGYTTYTSVNEKVNNKNAIKKSNNYHKKRGFSQVRIFGKNGGICHEKETIAGQHVYYLKPCEWIQNSNPKNKKVNLFATDIVLLGSLNECDMYGVPQAFKYLSSTSYIMPTNLALTNMETDGALYAYGDNMTICSSKNQSTMNSDDPNLEIGVREVKPDLYGELNYFSGASENYDVDYSGDETDTMPMTEAAGIAWNYTGPGQGDIKETEMYYPGGHFLGISCSNSQTNIKSCLNLERICEQGVVMSQRKVDVRSIESGDVSDFRYVYTAPTGFIAKDEIIDDYFRSMFATMNHKRLVATKMNEHTGYLMYDFNYLNPIYFGGEFSNFAKPNTSYNKVLNISDESQQLAAFGITNASDRFDFDSDEATNTQTRTIENTSIDYYRFRFGLDYEDLTTNNQKHKRKFASESQNKMYLPQYENSYYFYFGLHAGSTAIDEFNKQYFSQCENNTLIERASDIIVTISNFNLCYATSNVTVETVNMEAPYEYIVYEGNNIVSSTTSNDMVYSANLSSGEYQIVVRDVNGVELTRNISIGDQLVLGDFEYINFNLKLNGGTLTRTANNSNLFYGGAVKCTDVRLDTTQMMDFIMLIAFNAETGDLESTMPLTGGTQYMYLSSANTYYNFYVTYNPAGCMVSDNKRIFINKEMLYDTSIVTLEVGPVYKSNPIGIQNMYHNNWWVGGYTEPITDYTTHPVARWNVRKAITNSICTSGATNTNYVTTNGEKLVFGSPQNTGGIYLGSTQNNPIYIDTYNTPAGYTVDDDYSYYPTYGTLNYPYLRQYNAISYLGDVVYGSFVGIVSGASGFEKTVIAQSNIDWLRDGDACIFKSITTNRIYPAISISGSSNWSVKFIMTGDTQDIENWNSEEYGIVYPTICYPSVNRPFSVNAQQFIVNTTFGFKENKKLDLRNRAKTEAEIKNGITFKGNFIDYSYIDGIENIPSRAIEDLQGVTQTDSMPIILKLSGLTGFNVGEDGTFVDIPTDFSYRIAEGYPRYRDTENEEPNTSYSAVKTNTYKYLNPAANRYDSEINEISDSLNCNFYDRIYYLQTSNSPYTYIFACDGISDNDIEYHCVEKTYLVGLFPTSTNTSYYSSIITGNGEIYVLSQYGLCDTNPYYAEDDLTVIRLMPEGSHYRAYFYAYTSEGYEEVEVGGTYADGHGGQTTDSDIRDIVDSAITHVNTVYSGVRLNGLKFKKAFFSNDYDLYSIIQNSLNSSNIITNNRVIPRLPNDEICVIGVKKHTNPITNSSIFMYMIYETPIRLHSVASLDRHKPINR